VCCFADGGQILLAKVHCRSGKRDQVLRHRYVLWKRSARSCHVKLLTTLIESIAHRRPFLCDLTDRAHDSCRHS
jgi:hypothetical protein